MTVESSKNLAGIGAILIAIGFFGAFVPYAGLLELIGVILLMIGVWGLASYYREGGIFNNTLYALIILIVGAVIAVATLVITAVAALADLGIDLTNVTDWSTLGPQISSRLTNLSDLSGIMNLIGAFALGVLILFVVVVVAAFFFRRSLTSLSAKTGVGLFATAGLLMLIGAVLTIILIGILLIWIAWVLVAVAFFEIRAQPVQAAPPPPTPPT